MVAEAEVVNELDFSDVGAVDVADLFCGAGGSFSGIASAFWKINKRIRGVCVNHWQTAIEIHEKNHPSVRHFISDVSNIDPRKLYTRGHHPRVLWASPSCTHHSVARGGKPVDDQQRSSAWCVVRWARHIRPTHMITENVKEFCFPETTTVLSKRGIIPIGELVVGDEVWTHNARWKPVIKITRSRKDTVLVKGYGNSIAEPTGNHRYYARQVAVEITKSGKCGRHKSRLLEPEWTAASDLAIKDESSEYTKAHSGFAWATPLKFPVYWMRMPRTLGVDVNADAFFYMLGRWLGDGWIHKRKVKQSTVRICCEKSETDDLRKKLNNTGLTWNESEHSESVDVFDLCARESKILIPWLINNFRQYADQKTIPAWLFGATESQRRTLIEGHCDADGHEQENGCIAHISVSRCLAVGLRLLLQSLSIPASISSVPAQDMPYVGDPTRVMHCKEAYSVSWRGNCKWEKGHRSDLHLWGLVREVSPCRKDVEVVDITVADDHSFIADGQVVHNCDWGPLKQKRDKNGVRVWIRFYKKGSVYAGKKLTKDKHIETTSIPFLQEKGEHYRHYLNRLSAEWYEPSMIADRAKKGQHFRKWLRAIRKLGYDVTYGVKCSADYGDPTIRKRLFVLAVDKSTGRKNVWPTPTHAKPDAEGNVPAGRKPWRTARNSVIDWSLVGPSLWNRKTPLVDKTFARVVHGWKTYGLSAFFVPKDRGWDGMNVRSVDAPVSTLTTHHRGEGLVEPYFVAFFGNRKGQDPRTVSVDDPMHTVECQRRHGLVEPFLVELMGQSKSHDVNTPLNTVLNKAKHYLTIPYLLKMRGTGLGTGWR